MFGRRLFWAVDNTGAAAVEMAVLIRVLRSIWANYIA